MHLHQRAQSRHHRTHIAFLLSLTVTVVMKVSQRCNVSNLFSLSFGFFLTLVLSATVTTLRVKRKRAVIVDDADMTDAEKDTRDKGTVFLKCDISLN